ncbi:uncharacterized protein LOC111307719 isoform X3 [Durio zibethinus]|uniref:Uncharacterized protein LOC111307719 isoform X3 n=1 Tax=Durio zibethinus TaxID=66656 RepID=A0A6P6A9T5_DURZI|nr:uncharacterized protein LOC111307719 isoform X3 [Durio zibethinus]
MGSSALKALVVCAQAIQDGNLKLADSLLELIWNLASEESDEQQSKVVKYFAEALVRRVCGLHPSVRYNLQWLPYAFTCLTGDAVNTVVTRKKRLHLIDFNIPHLYGWQPWEYLFGALNSRYADPLSVRVSVILPPFLKESVNIQQEKPRLLEWARDSKVELEDDLKVVYANSLGEMDASMLDFRRSEDEAVVVFYIFKLQMLLVDAGAMERELLKLRQINPEIVMIMEQDANNNDFNFIKRLEDSFQYYSHAFRFDGDSYQEMENDYRRQIMSIVGCEGKDRIVRHETLGQWRSRLLTYGFLPVPLEATSMLVSVYDEIHEENGCWVFCEGNLPMFFISAWKVRQWEDHFNLISDNFVQGFNPIPTSEDKIQPLQLLRESFSLNRLAAFAEIYDMLDDVCFKYKLTLALTWACGVNVKQNLDGITSDPYKKDILCIESAYSYVNDEESQQFMRRCAKQNHLLGGQAIVGKALQSNEPFLFESSIAKPEKCDNQFAIVAREFGPHAALAICLQNHCNDVYVVEFFLPLTEGKLEKPESMALDIFNDLKNMKKMFVTLRVHGTEVGFQEEATSNIRQVTMSMQNLSPASSTNDFLNSNTTRPLNTFEARDGHVELERQGFNEQGTMASCSNQLGMATIGFSSVSIHASSVGGICPFNAPKPVGYDGVLETQGTWKQEIKKKNCVSQTISNGNNNIVKVNKVCTIPRTKQRKLVSDVWKDFIKFEVDGKQWAKCNHCHKKFTGSSKSGTTHLKNHLERCPIKKSECQERQLKFPAETGDSTTQDTNERNSTFDQERSRLDLVKMIIKHQFPLDTAELEFFKNFVKNLQPMFEFQSQAIILSDIHRIYEVEKEKLKQYLDQLACNFSLTISMWKDNPRKIAYCCLIAHFIDDGWELKAKIIAFKILEHSYDTGTLIGIIRSSILEWNMSKKVCSITVDNSSLKDDLVQQIKEACLSDQGSLLSSHCFISCSLIQDGLHEIDDIVSKMRKSIEYISETAHGKLKFQEAVNQVKLKVGKSRDDLPLRLDSDFGILDCALELREIFCQMEQIDGSFRVNPSMEEWDKAIALHSCLKGFYDILSSFEGIQSLTANLYFPKLCNIYKKFLQLEKSSYPFVSSMKRKFDNYWSLCNLVFTVAVVLDPRLKFKFVEFSYSEIYGRDSKMQLNKFHKVLMEVYHEYADEPRILTTSASDFGDFGCSTGQSTQIANDCILDSFSKFASAGNFNELASWKSELDCYLDEPLLRLDETSFDILGWWRVNSERFPTLGRMAHDLLAMPVSIVPPCSDLSAVITNPAYSSLNPESLEALACSQNWLEMSKGSGRANHVPQQNMAKRKMEEKETHALKNFQREGMAPLKSSEPNHGRNISGLIEIPNGGPSSDNESEFQCFSSESDGEVAWREHGEWHEEDIRAYLISDFTEKESKRLKRWQSHEMSGKLIGRDKEFGVLDYKLACLLIVPHGDETRTDYYINDLLFLPLCLSQHWILFYVDVKKQRFSWLDSIESSRMLHVVEKEAILGWFKRFLLPTLGYNNANKWPFELRYDIPVQENLVDCGLFVMKYADCLTHGDVFPFTQQDMAHFRRRTFLDIYKGRLHCQK